ncbi:MAG: oligosaccharide flippase family protein [Gemmatimonadales bacterium]
MSSRASPIRNTLTHWGGFVLSALIGFLLSPVVVRELGNSVYGIWILITSVTGYLGLLDLGVRGAVIRYVARFHAQGDHESANSIASTAIAMFTVLGVLAVVVAGALALGLPVIFHDVPAEHLPEARLALLLTGGAVGLSLVASVYGGVVGGLQRFDLINAWAAGTNIVRSALVYFAVTRGYGILALAAIALLVTSWYAVVTRSLARGLYPELVIRRRLAEWKWVGVIFSFGLASVMINASHMLIGQADAIVIAAFLPVAQVTFFSIGAGLVHHAQAIQRGVTFMIPAMISAMQAKGTTDGVRRTVIRGARALSMILLPIAVTFLIRGSSFIGLWMGPEYSELSGRVLQILTVRMWFTAGMGVLSTSLQGLNRHQKLVPVMIAEALTNLALSIALVRPFGVVGVALGTALPSLVTVLGVFPRIYRRELGIGLGNLAREIWGRTTLAVIPFAAATWAIERTWPADGLLQFFAQVAAILPLAFAGAWILAMDDEDRNVIRGRFHRMFRSLA